MPTDAANAVAELTGRVLDGGFDNVFWHGPLWRHVEALTVEQALWRPGPDRHGIWDIVRHVTFWRRHFIAWYSSAPMPDVDTGNWSRPVRGDEPEWRADLAALQRTQDVVQAIIKSDARPILLPNETGAFRAFSNAAGLACHDAYHTGQIALLRVLQGLPSIE